MPSTVEMFKVSFLYIYIYIYRVLTKQNPDHILTLQQSLVYYERMLSDWNPTYISQLGAEISIAKNKADLKLLYVTTVALCCSTNLIVIGRLTAFLYRNLILIHLRCILHERQAPNQSP